MRSLAPLVVALLCCSACDDPAVGPQDGGETDAGRVEPGTDAGPSRDAGASPPGGERGIAARYPGDEGIGGDPAVIFADDFEGYADASELDLRWNAGVYHDVQLATDGDDVFAGARSLELRVPQQSDELSNTVARDLGEELDVIYLRYYTRYHDSFDVVGSSHNGATIAAHYYENGRATPGVPADGTNKFLASFEAWRGEESEPNPGRLNVYLYHPEQRSQWGDHFFPTGTVLPRSDIPFEWAPSFMSRPDFVPELGRWYSFEIMVRANTPGELDGQISCWADGALIADFVGLRLRDVPSLRIDRFSLDLHVGSNPRGETFKHYDNVVAATEYIGPMMPR